MENNNLLVNEPEIESINELLEMSKKVKTIMQQIKEIDENPNIDKFERKILKTQLQNKINDSQYMMRLTKGIYINRDDLINEVIEMMINFLNIRGYTSEILINRLKNVKFYISDIELISGGGKFDNMNSLIGIDYHYCVFDENGVFIKLDDKKKNTLIHAISHELFHDLSRVKKDQPLNEALNEGMTEMFAHTVSRRNGVNIESSWYSFIEKICEMFTLLVGFDKVFMDYIDDPIVLKCIGDLFNECGKSNEEFILFKNQLNRYLTLKSKNVDCYEIEKEIVNFLKNTIVIPYIKSHPELTDEAIEKFNTTFGNYVLINETELDKNKIN